MIRLHPSAVSARRSFVDVLRARAAQHGERVALAFQREDDSAEEWTYADLDARARAVAASLVAMGLEGRRALLLYPPGLEFVAAFFGCLYAGVVAVPSNLPRANRPMPRLRSIVTDAGPDAILTASASLGDEPRWRERVGELAGVPCLATDAIPLPLADEWEPRRPNRADLAFLQYTSGSTSAPKGVAITHGNLLANSEEIRACFGSHEGSRGVFWLPLFHDMGLIGGVLQTIDCGGASLLMSPIAFLQRPRRWLEAISRTGATISGGPDFAYDLCVRKIPPEQRANLDLSRWSVAFNGAEPIRAETIERFCEAFAPCGFRREAFLPCYGLAESTLLVSGERRTATPQILRADPVSLARDRYEPAADGDRHAHSLVGSGAPSPRQEVVIADPSTGRRLEDGRVGEVWVRGLSVASGYWERKEETRAAFGARLADSGEGPFLRTGDLGFRHDGTLFVTGRLKDLIIVRGRNLYPQDLEWSAAASHPALRPNGAAAFSLETADGEGVGLVAELERPVKPPEAERIVAAIRRALAEDHELDVRAIRLLRPLTLPRTSSGKVQRRECRDALLAGTLECLAAWDRASQDSAEEGGAPASEPALPRSEAELAPWLTSRLARVLKVPADEIDPARPITGYGLDSLSAMEFRSAVESELGVEIPLTMLLDGATIADLAREAATRRAEPTTAPAPSCDPIGGDTLSIGQQSLWYAHQLSPRPGEHNIAGAARIEGDLDPDAFRRAVQGLVDRHEAFRSSFPLVEGRPALRVAERAEADLRLVDATSWDESRLASARDEEAGRPFDLESGPLHRVVLWSRSPREHHVLLAMHHIVGDFWSTAVILDEFGKLYAAEVAGAAADLPEAASYRRFIAHQARRLEGPAGDRLKGYWTQRLALPLPDAELPLDRARTTSRSHAGAVRSMRLDAELTASLVALARETGTSLYVLLLSALQVLLGRYAGQDDVIVGSPVAGRTASGFEGIVGYFVNLLPMRADLAGNPAFREFLARARRVVSEALEHQEYPFARMVDDLALPPDAGRSPVFSVMFVYQKAQRLGEAGLTPFALPVDGNRMPLAGLALESLALSKGAALFDLTLMAALADGRLALAMEYDADLFEAASVDRILRHYRTLLGSIVADPSRTLDALEILTAEEREFLHAASSAPGPEPGSRRAVHELFSDQARRKPGAIAVVSGRVRWTYGELDRRSSNLAARLRPLGVGRGSLVGICAEKSPRLLMGLLGILKAGGAYLPLDPSHPGPRRAEALRTAGATLLLAEGPALEDLRDAAPDVLDLERLAREPAPEGGMKDDSAVAPGDLAYVITTSGSTGEPKGVAITHGNLAAAFAAWEDAYGLSGLKGPHLQMAGVAFDVFTGDWARALGSGAALVLCPREAMLDPEALADLLVRERIAFAEFVPAVVEPLLAHLESSGRALPDLKLLAVGSDLLRVGTYERLKAALGPRARVVNSYGLTEATIDSTYFEGSLLGVEPDRVAPIGRPFPGTHAYVLDDRFRPVPPGMRGELFLGGPGVGMGYWKRPRASAERFVPDPFADRPGALLFRTGDLARWRADGTLELLGRADAQVKIRGYRLEPGEVESALLKHPEVREAAVVARGAPEPHLAAFLVAGAGLPDEADLRRWLRERLPDPMIPASIVVLDRLPLSANGKVDRKALAAIEPPKREGRGDRVAPRTPTEAALCGIVAEVLAREAVGADDDLFALGADSIRIIQIVTRARAAGLTLSPAQVFRSPRIADLAASVGTASGGPSPSATPADLLGEDREAIGRVLAEDPSIEAIYPLTPVQHGLLFEGALDPDSGAYIEQFRCELIGPVDDDALMHAWKAVANRHPALRTAVRWTDTDRPFQAVLRDAELPVERLDWSGLTESETPARFDDFLREDRRKGFAATLAPLARLALIRLGTDRRAMIWTSHHMIVDGWCIPIVLDEVLTLYEAVIGGTEPGLAAPRPFVDYVEWLHRRDRSGDEAFWRSRLAGFREPTPLPFERATVPRGLLAFAEVERRLGRAECEAIRRFARSNRLTLGTLVYGAWSLLLSRYAGTSDVVFGATVSGRPTDLDGVERIVGVLINTLPLRVPVDEEAAALPWLRALQDRVAAMHPFEATPLGQIRGWSDIPAARPLFESIVIVQNTPLGEALASRASRLGIRDPRILDQTSYPLTVTAVPGEEIALRIGYDARRFDRGPVATILDHLANLLRGLAAQGGGVLADLALAPGAAGFDVVTRPDGGPLPPAGGLRAGLAHPPLDAIADEDLDSYLADLGVSMGGEDR